MPAVADHPAGARPPLRVIDDFSHQRGFADRSHFSHPPGQFAHTPASPARRTEIGHRSRADHARTVGRRAGAPGARAGGGQRGHPGLSSRALARQRAAIGMVFQRFNLYAHKTALENVMREVAETGMTMIVVTHEIGFAREVCDQAVFVTDGVVVESGAPGDVLRNPRQARTHDFLNRVL